MLCAILAGISETTSDVCIILKYGRTSGKKSSVYRGTLGSRRSVLGQNETLKEQLSFCRHYLSALLLIDLLGSANCEINIQIVAIQY